MHSGVPINVRVALPGTWLTERKVELVLLITRLHALACSTDQCLPQNGFLRACKSARWNRPADLASAMHRQGLPSPGQESEFGDQLLRELMGPIHIVAAGDDAGQLVGCHVRLHHHLCKKSGQPHLRAKFAHCLMPLSSIGCPAHAAAILEMNMGKFHTAFWR